MTPFSFCVFSGEVGDAEEVKPQNLTTAIEKTEDPLPVPVSILKEVPETRPKKRTAHATATPKTGEGGGGVFDN